MGSDFTAECGALPSAPGVAQHEIEAFFHAYARALDSIDVERIASMHHAPLLHVHGDGSIQCFSTHEAVRSFFLDLTERYRARGLHSGSFVDLAVVPIGAHAALVTLTWELRRADQSLLRRFRRSYNVCRSGANWMIVVATAHRE